MGFFVWQLTDLSLKKELVKLSLGLFFSGEVEVEQFVRHLPSGARLRVRKLHAQGQESSSACVGQRCAVNISGSELGKIEISAGLVGGRVPERDE